MISDADFQNEVRYRTVMKIAGEMLAAGIISESERKTIDAIMLEKYRPILSMLLSGKPLIRQQKRGETNA